MPVKPYVLCGNEGINHIWRDPVIISPGTVLYVEFPQHHIVLRIDLCGKTVIGVLELLEGGDRPQPVCRYQDEQCQQQNCRQRYYHPEPDYVFPEFLVPHDTLIIRPLI